jgi:GntR family transcriptional regulator
LRLSLGMHFQKIKPDSTGVALYKVVARSLLHAIQLGQLKPGDALTSEAELSKTFGVSVGTLRKAVDELVAQQILVRYQGRGTYVATHNRDRFLDQFFRVEAQSGLKDFPLVETVDFEKGGASAGEALMLGLVKGEPVLRIKNHLTLQERKVVNDEICLPAQLFKGLTAKRVRERSSTLYHLYQTEFGVTVINAEERLRAVACSEAMGKISSRPVGTPMIELHRIAWGLNGQAVEYRRWIIDTTQHEYVSRLAPG